MEHSPLARLPRELRDQIIDNLLLFPGARICLHNTGSNEAVFSVPLERDRNHGFFGLILTCRWMHDEATQRLYGNHIFAITTAGQKLSIHETFENFITMIGTRNASHLRSIELSYLLLGLNGNKLRQSIEQIMCTAKTIPKCSVTVLVTYIDAYSSIAIRAELVLDKMLEPDDSWIESVESITGVQDAAALDTNIELLRTHLRDCKAYIESRQVRDHQPNQPVTTAFSGIFAAARRLFQYDS
jgi:hypothetical protein